MADLAQSLLMLPPAFGVLGLLAAFVIYGMVKRYPEGQGKVKEIGDAIHLGAMVFMRREYTMLLMFASILVVALYFALNAQTAIAFVVGAGSSALAGWIGMYAATKANVRTTIAAHDFGAPQALSVAFFGGSIMGLCVASLGLLGLGALYYFFGGDPESAHNIHGFGMGASSVALFSRVGGGIFTKGADVGSDLVGKIETGIPEDDPRNAGVIADNVGDNVGDCAGMAADLFETYAVTMVATMLLAAIFFTGAAQEQMMLFPLVIGGVCIIGSVVATWFVKLGSSQSIMGALYKGFIASAVISGALIGGVISVFIGWDTAFQMGASSVTGTQLFIAALTGLGVTGLIVWITEYYTGTEYRPVKSVAAASETGHATNVIQGLAVSMEATALPVIVICAGIIVSYLNAGLFGIAIAATTMLALAGMVVALDAFGPVTDNAGGIAEMVDLPEEVRNTTDALDAVGNTTKAVTKGYAIGSAGLAALVLFAAYTEDLKHYFPDVDVTFRLQDPYVVIGLFIGGLLPYLFGAMGMMAVGRAGGQVVVEVRRQFKEIPGIMEGTAKPEYGKCVDLLTKAAIKEMIVPSMLPVLAPVVMYFVVNAIAGQANAFAALGAMLLGTIVTGLFVALSMTSGGGAWDNAKKYIEDGNHGGKGSDAHHAAVTGDTVGDPYKDTAGPAVNPMIKIINIVAILLLAILA